MLRLACILIVHQGHKLFFHSFMFAPVGFSVVVTRPNGESKTIAVLDYKDQAIKYAKDGDAAVSERCILDRPVYTVKQNYPTSAYID